MKTTGRSHLLACREPRPSEPYTRRDETGSLRTPNVIPRHQDHGRLRRSSWPESPSAPSPIPAASSFLQAATVDKWRASRWLRCRIVAPSQGRHFTIQSRTLGRQLVQRPTNSVPTTPTETPPPQLSSPPSINPLTVRSHVMTPAKNSSIAVLSPRHSSQSRPGHAPKLTLTADVRMPVVRNFDRTVFLQEPCVNALPTFQQVVTDQPLNGLFAAQSHCRDIT